MGAGGTLWVLGGATGAGRTYGCHREAWVLWEPYRSHRVLGCPVGAMGILWVLGGPMGAAGTLWVLGGSYMFWGIQWVPWGSWR